MIMQIETGGSAMGGNCESCAFSVYDDELGDYVCEAYLDEDEYVRLLRTDGPCPYYRSGDEYELVRRQN